MSITFYIENGEQTTDCECVEVGPDATSDCWGCGGTGELDYSRNVHEANMSNASAHELLRLLALPVDAHGRIPTHELSEILRRAIKVANSEAARAGAVYNACITRDENGDVLFVDGGSTHAQIARRARALSVVLRAAVDADKPVIWA